MFWKKKNFSINFNNLFLWKILHYYIFIGGFDDNAPLDCVERYNVQENQWEIVAKMSCFRGGVGVASLGGRIYAVGGHDGSHYLRSVEMYDALTDR